MLKKQNIDFKKDQEIYNKECKPSFEDKDSPLDLWRFNLVLNLCQKFYMQKNPFLHKYILNVGAGWGREAYFILRQAPRLLILNDYSLVQIKYAKEYLDNFDNKFLMSANGENLPFKDATFDISFITEALHHFSNPEKGIEELLRVTKGAIFIDEPRQGVIRGILNGFFVKLHIKDNHEHGYLEPYRIDKELLNKLYLKYCFNIIQFPYFIYYFKWYKRTRNIFIKDLYKFFLCILNNLFHSFGNRVIVIIKKSDRFLK